LSENMVHVKPITVPWRSSNSSNACYYDSNFTSSKLEALQSFW